MSLPHILIDESITNGTKTVVDISDPSKWACEESGLTEGLWLNLSDGYIGSGRSNWDGSGGTGAAKTHYETLLNTTGKNYPLVVKLGTITPDGKGDVYSYASDENDAVIDPKLHFHLQRLGIDINCLKKTEKSTAELQIELVSKCVYTITFVSIIALIFFILFYSFSFVFVRFRSFSFVFVRFRSFFFHLEIELKL